MSHYTRVDLWSILKYVREKLYRLDYTILTSSFDLVLLGIHTYKYITEK